MTKKSLIDAKNMSIDSATVPTATTCVQSRLALARVYVVHIAASHGVLTEP